MKLSVRAFLEAETTVGNLFRSVGAWTLDVAMPTGSEPTAEDVVRVLREMADQIESRGLRGEG